MTTPLLPIDSLRDEIGYHPWHFWQLTNRLIPVTSACNGLIREYSWQNTDEIGRHEIRRAIISAETKLREYLRYSVAPRYVTSEIQYPRPADTRMEYWAPVDTTDRWLSVQLPEGYIQAIGIEQLTLIGTVSVGAGSLVFSDEDGDGLFETFTATIATTVTDTSQIAIYFSAADRLNNEAVGARWRIEPVYVSISGGIATIVGKRWLLVRPIKYQGVAHSNLDPDTAGNFVTSLEVYQRTTNPNGTTTETSQAVLIWETAPYPWWASCCGGGATDSRSDPAATATAIARVGIRDAKLGIVTVGEATYNSETGIWSKISWDGCRQPDRVIIRYLAGYPLENGQMSSVWRSATARMAAAEMQPRITACDVGSHWLWQWTFDLSRAAGANDEQYQIGPGDLENPFGTRRGQVDAWHKVKNSRQVRGFLPG